MEQVHINIFLFCLLEFKIDTREMTSPFSKKICAIKHIYYYFPLKITLEVDIIIIINTSSFLYCVMRFSYIIESIKIYNFFASYIMLE